MLNIVTDKKPVETHHPKNDPSKVVDVHLCPVTGLMVNEEDSAKHVPVPPPNYDPVKLSEAVNTGPKKNLCYVVPNCPVTHNNMDPKCPEEVPKVVDAPPNERDKVDHLHSDHTHHGYPSEESKKHDEVAG